MKRIFPNADGMFERYHSLRDNEPYRVKREKYLMNYMRRNWRRGGRGKDKDKQDPNFGQFRAKIDSAIGTFMQVLTERPVSIKIVPRYVDKNMQKRYSEAISSAFHRHFIKPWEDRFLIDANAAFDMVMSAKAIEHWPNLKCLYSESVPVERVFPDTNAGHNVKKWNYVFIEKDFTLTELEGMLADVVENSKKMKSDIDDELIIFKEKELRAIIDHPETYTRGGQSTEKNEGAKRNRGEMTEGNRDYSIPIVFLYVKDMMNKEKKVSLYCFPAEHNVPKESPEDAKWKNIKLLYEKEGYSECISQSIANRTYLLSRNWYSCESFAEQIYLATALYDKSMSLFIRAAKRNAILYFTSDNPKSVTQLLQQIDDEVQFIPTGTQHVTTQQNTGIRDVVESTRQIMLDTENGQSLAQAPGSQNVKGYAITAEEAGIRARAQGEAEGLNIKILMSGDVALWKEIYRRAMDGADSEFDKALEAFNAEMKALNIDKEVWDFENVYFAPSFLNGASQMIRISNAQGTAQALAIDPKNPGQVQAQRDLVGAFVGIDNIDSYISEDRLPSPSVVKAGAENQLLDDTFVNPTNIPVLPDDLHLQEIPVHLQDYELKLTMAQKIMEQSQSTANPLQQLIYVNMARDLIVAQDNKGSHIQAHLQMVEPSKINQLTLDQILPVYKQLQQRQDEMTNQVVEVLKQLEESLKTSALNDEKVRHAQAINQLTEEHTKTMQQFDVEKAVSQRQFQIDRNEDKREAELISTGTKLAKEDQSAEIKLKEQENALEAKRKEAELKAAKSSSAGTAA